MNKVMTINIGNTHTHYGVCIDGKIAERGFCKTSELSSDIVPKGMRVAIASVVPEKNEIFKEHNPLFISDKLELPVDFSAVESEKLGADRIANAVALAKFAKLPAICIDCGTAITIEALNQDAIFLGGIIAPGRKLQRQSLHNYTAQLPIIENYSEKSPSALGKTTASAIIAGCDLGILEMAKGIIAKVRHELGAPDCQIIATGGDAEFFSTNVLEIGHGGSDFTLRGIAAIYEENINVDLDKN